MEKGFPEAAENESDENGWKDQVKILNLGCGNSILPEELYDRGFKHVYNVDISPVVIE